MAKERTEIPTEVASAVLFDQDRTCCVCREPGKHVQLHHIDEDPSNNSPGNLAVLCLEHHNDTQLRGGFARKLSAETVIRYRDEWIEAVRRRRQEADKIVVARMTAGFAAPATSWKRPPQVELMAFIDHLPELRRAARAVAQPEWDAGGTSRARRATTKFVDVLERALARLADWYPPNHFDAKPAEVYFNKFVADRYIWHRVIYQPDQPGSGGTIGHYHAGGGVLNHLGSALADMVAFHLVGDDFNSYQPKGQRAGGWVWAMPDQMPSQASDALSEEGASDGEEGT